LRGGSNINGTKFLKFCVITDIPKIYEVSEVVVLWYVEQQRGDRVKSIFNFSLCTVTRDQFVRAT
jgi:hypothetical protein